MTWAMMSSGQSRTPWRFLPAVNLTGIAGTVILVTVVGVLSFWGVLMRKPSAVLREQ
jgi:hypothetical protein